MGFAEGFSAGSSARQGRDLLRARADERNQELFKAGYSFNNGGMQVRSDSQAEGEQLQFKETAQLAKALQGKLAAQDTDRAFEDYAHTGDASYLQGAMDNNPVLKQAWGQKGVHLVSNIDFKNDGTLLSNSGLTDTHYDTPEKQSIIQKNAYKIYNGKDWSIGLANKAVAETGALTRMGQRRAEPILNNYHQFQDLLSGPKVSPHTAEGHKYEKEIMAASAKYPEVPVNLIAAMMYKESNGDPKAVSSKGAGGLMQIMPETAKELGVSNVHDPAQNIEGSFKYMNKLMDKYDGDIPKALAAYNAGPGNVDKYNGIPPFGETQDYVKTVLANFDQGEQYYNRSADDTISTILEQRRAIANAANGTTNANVDQGVKNQVRQLDQTDRQMTQKDRDLDLTEARDQIQQKLDQYKLVQEDTKINQTDKQNQLAERKLELDDLVEKYKLNQGDQGISQKDRELDIKEQENKVKLLTEGTTTKQKDLSAADDETNKLLDKFGGEGFFMKTDFSDQKNFTKAYPNMIKIEALTGTQPTESQMKDITDLRGLISLGDPASKLTGEQTGLVDSTLKGIEQYFSDNVKGEGAKSAYSAFRNSVRHALFGSALTEGEIKSFNDAYGSLGTKLGPALEMFQTSLTQVQSKLDSTMNLMNPYSAQIRLGADQKKLLKIRDALQERVNYIKGLNGGTTADKSKRVPLDDIFSKG